MKDPLLELMLSNSNIPPPNNPDPIKGVPFSPVESFNNDEDKIEDWEWRFGKKNSGQDEEKK